MESYFELRDESIYELIHICEKGTVMSAPILVKGPWRDDRANERVLVAGGKIAEAKAAASNDWKAWGVATDEARKKGLNSKTDQAAINAGEQYRRSKANLVEVESKAFADSLTVILNREVPIGREIKHDYLEHKRWGVSDLERLRKEDGAVGRAAQIMLDDREAVWDFLPETERIDVQSYNFGRLDIAVQSRPRDGWDPAALTGGDGIFSVDDATAFLSMMPAGRSRDALRGVELNKIDAKAVGHAATVLADAWDSGKVQPDWFLLSGKEVTMDHDDFVRIRDEFGEENDIGRAASIIDRASKETFAELDNSAYSEEVDGEVGVEDLRTYASKYR